MPALAEKEYTPIGQIQSGYDRLKKSFSDETILPLAKRREQLTAMYNLVTENEEALCAAVKADLGKHENETYAFELQVVVNECIEMLGKRMSPIVFLTGSGLTALNALQKTSTSGPNLAVLLLLCSIRWMGAKFGETLSEQC